MLGMLNAVEQDSNITQRHLARELGIALGLANAYLRRCAKKGFIKIRQVPLNRYGYYLTPRGFAEKSRLTAEYLAVSFDFFRRAREESVALLSGCRTRGWRRALLWGAGELAEVMVLSAAECLIEVACVVDPAATQTVCAGRPIFRALGEALAAAGAVDVIVITETRAPREAFDAARADAAQAGLGADRVLAPPMLHLSPPKAVA